MEKISTLEGWMIAYDFKSKINFYPPLESCLMTYQCCRAINESSRV